MTVWDEVVGQARAVATLQDAAAAAHRVVAGEPAAAGSMTHAWLFTGPPGSGRSVAARAFAAALQCERDGVGCGECAGCHTVHSRTHADVHIVVPEGLSIAVQEMRSIVLTAGRLPSLGRWQVVLVEDADRLTEAASNALLKAVEEPPQRTVFLLCAPSTHPDDVTVTIRSRCRVVPLGSSVPGGRRRMCWYGGTASTRPRRSGRPRRPRAMSAGPGGWPGTPRRVPAGRRCCPCRRR